MLLEHFYFVSGLGQRSESKFNSHSSHYMVFQNCWHEPFFIKMVHTSRITLQNSLILGHLLPSVCHKYGMNRRRKSAHGTIIQWLQNAWTKGVTLFFQVFLSVFFDHQLSRPIRQGHRLPRLQGWWNMIWHNSNDKRFMLNFRIIKGTFLYIIHQIHNHSHNF